MLSQERSSLPESCWRTASELERQARGLQLRSQIDVLRACRRRDISTTISRSGSTRYKFRGSSGKVNFAVDRVPQFEGREGTAHLRGDVAIAPSIDYLERAYDEAKYGNFSRRPYINLVVPSLLDPSVAPPGKHVVSCFVQYAPVQAERGT